MFPDGRNEFLWSTRIHRHGWLWNHFEVSKSANYPHLCTDNTFFMFQKVLHIARSWSLFLLCMPCKIVLAALVFWWISLCWITLLYISFTFNIHSFLFCFILFRFVLCSTTVKFSVRELSEVKRVASHHLRLLGFKPLDCLKDYHNLRPSTFVYPSDQVTVFFWACFSSCSLLLYCNYPLNAENVVIFSMSSCFWAFGR